jgi:hypothetical protein
MNVPIMGVCPVAAAESNAAVSRQFLARHWTESLSLYRAERRLRDAKAIWLEKGGSGFSHFQRVPEGHSIEVSSARSLLVASRTAIVPHQLMCGNDPKVFASYYR